MQQTVVGGTGEWEKGSVGETASSVVSPEANGDAQLNGDPLAVFRG